MFRKTNPARAWSVSETTTAFIMGKCFEPSIRSSDRFLNVIVLQIFLTVGIRRDICNMCATGKIFQGKHLVNL
jgi:hypothetical protein